MGTQSEVSRVSWVSRVSRVSPDPSVGLVMEYIWDDGTNADDGLLGWCIVGIEVLPMIVVSISMKQTEFDV